MYLLGQCYEQGRGVDQDVDKARELYRKAADKQYEKARQALDRLSAPRAPQAAEQPKAKAKRGFRWPFGKK